MKAEGLEKVIYFVRHGQSEGNIAPVFQSLDSPLSAKGREQAKLVAERATNLSFEALISSPLPRTKETAIAIASETDKIPEYADLFVERIKPTSIDGKPFDDSEAKKVCEQWERSLYTPGMRVEDGENFDDLILRADKALKYLYDRPEKGLLVVTHGYFLRAVFARVLLAESLCGESFRMFQSKIEMANTGISVLKYETRWNGPSWFVWTYNDLAHLG